MTDDDGSTGPAGGVMFGPVLVHSAREALDRFELVQGDGDAESRACVMTAISWMTGEAWSDAPSCAHPVLRSMTISANDAEDTSPEDRAAILLAGETGLVDTWWLPATVVAAAMARPCPAEGEELPDETAVERVLRTLAAVSAWKELGRPRPDLQGADLQGARAWASTVLPEGWQFDESTGLVVRASEVAE